MKEYIKNIKRLWKYTKGSRLHLLLYVLLNLIAVIIGIITPLYSAKLLVNLTNNLFKQFILISIILYIIECALDVVHALSNIEYEKICKTIHLKIQYDLGKEILKLNNKTIDTKGSGVFIQRLINDTSELSEFFININDYLSSILSSIGILGVFYVLNKTIFVFIIVSFIIRLYIESTRNKVRIKNRKQVKTYKDNLTGFTGELVRGSKDIKMLNSEKSFINELKNRFTFVKNEEYKANKTNYLFILVRAIWADTTDIILLLLIVYAVQNKTLSITNAIVIYNFRGKLNMLASGINYFQQIIRDFNLTSKRVFDIFDSKEYEKESFGINHINKVDGNFEFKDVSFKYDKIEVLKGVNFKVNANETVAFVGKSGSGKSTIFKLLTKMYDNYEGTILIDDNDIKKLDKDSIRGNITVVSQNPYIFNMSIKDNLRLVKENLTDKEMKEACKMACLENYIESLPDKYDTIIGEGGVNLSGGEKQRLAIARAFIQKTEIILFDEATSALDNETQANIQKSIDNLQKDYTILIIAHRLSTIKNANRIIMIDKGKIIAEGTHNKLLKTCKEYKHLYNTELTNEKNRTQ